MSTRCARPPLRYGPSGDTPPVPRLRQQLWALRPGLDGGVPAVHDAHGTRRPAGFGMGRRTGTGWSRRQRRRRAGGLGSSGRALCRKVSRVRWELGAGEGDGGPGRGGGRAVRGRPTPTPIFGVAARRVPRRAPAQGEPPGRPVPGCAVPCRSRIDVLTEPNRGVPFHVAAGVPFLVAISSSIRRCSRWRSRSPSSSSRFTRACSSCAGRGASCSLRVGRIHGLSAHVHFCAPGRQHPVLRRLASRFRQSAARTEPTR